MQTKVTENNYNKCDKPGLHSGELLTMICEQAECIDNSLCCCVCIQEEHQKHNIKSLKSVIYQAEANSHLLTTNNYNIDVIFDVIANHRKQTLEKFNEERKQLNEIFDKTEQSISQYYNQVIQEVKNKNIDPKMELSHSVSTIVSGNDTNQSRIHCSKLLKMLKQLQKKEQTSLVPQPDLIDNITMHNQSLKNIILSGIHKVKTEMSKHHKSLEQQIKDINMFRKKIQLYFSNILKHPNIDLITPYLAKSINAAGYKFALISPRIQISDNWRSYEFTIGECSSNWVAIGICNNNIVSTKNYSFSPASLGHGSYLISSNGGVWSNHNSQFNNKIKAFKFSKGDIISMKVSTKNKQLLFRKKNETFQMTFEIMQKDELYPCVLFYYVGDTVSCKSQANQVYP